MDRRLKLLKIGIIFKQLISYATHARAPEKASGLMSAPQKEHRSFVTASGEQTQGG